MTLSKEEFEKLPKTNKISFRGFVLGKIDKEKAISFEELKKLIVNVDESKLKLALDYLVYKKKVEKRIKDNVRYYLRLI